mmetsp:Transcript_12298/g.29571  ORF Transcript_12298/g.29571 Transcript_12298/m.29571 type:complete len:269 (-) Transcript_12298:213-1019(-)
MLRPTIIKGYSSTTEYRRQAHKIETQEKRKGNASNERHTPCCPTKKAIYVQYPTMNKPEETKKEDIELGDVAQDENPPSSSYPARLEVDYREDDVSRIEVLLRIFKIIPVLLFSAFVGSTLYLSTLIMVMFQLKYPRWWFDFRLEYKRYSTRIGTFVALMTDKYPSTTDEQIVHLDIDYPGQDVSQSMNRWGPLYKIILSVPHFFICFALKIGYLLALVVVWIYLLVAGGKYPKFIFDYIVSYWRWSLRYDAYTFLLVTDEYPPFSMK